jgi:hypothetical protein
MIVAKLRQKATVWQVRTAFLPVRLLKNHRPFRLMLPKHVRRTLGKPGDVRFGDLKGFKVTLARRNDSGSIVYWINRMV